VKLLFKILRFYINASIHVALAVGSFTCITYLDFDVDIEAYILVFVFFSTLVAYTFVKYIPSIKNRPFKWTKSLKAIFTLALISIIPIGVSLIYIDVISLALVGFLGLLTLLYVLPFLPKAKNLRDVSGLKIFIIALVWSGTTVVLPLVAYDYSFTWYDSEFLSYICSRFFIVVALIIPFEIRDLKLDDIYLQTLPQVLGVIKTKILAVVLVILSMFLLIYSHLESYIYVFIHGIIIILILGSKRKNAFLYTALMVESVPILWVVMKYFAS
jgi:hypothetical protein